MSIMLTLKEKLYLLQLLKRNQRRRWFNRKANQELDQQLIEKLEQMVRNERVNQKYL